MKSCCYPDLKGYIDNSSKAFREVFFKGSEENVEVEYEKNNFKSNSRNTKKRKEESVDKLNDVSVTTSAKKSRKSITTTQGVEKTLAHGKQKVSKKTPTKSVIGNSGTMKKDSRRDHGRASKSQVRRKKK